MKCIEEFGYIISSQIPHPPLLKLNNDDIRTRAVLISVSDENKDEQLSYEIEIKQSKDIFDDWETNLLENKNTVKIDKLKEGTKYQARGRCKNKFGYSSYSKILEFETKKLVDLIVDKHTILESDKEHQFDNVVIKEGAILTCDGFDTISQNGGKLILNIENKLIIHKSGWINMNGKGYKGGIAKTKEPNGFACQGESYDGSQQMKRENNFGGGGGGVGSIQFGSTGGGGGGYGTKGENAQNNTYREVSHEGGLGGDIYGDAKLTVLYHGSGGGSGHCSSYHNGYRGGNGGGVIKITAAKISIETNGCISCDGDDGENVKNLYRVSGGGGGSGGSIFLKCKTLDNEGTITALGGKGALHKKGETTCSSGGNGGNGRIRIDYEKILQKGIIKPEIGYSKPPIVNV